MNKQRRPILSQKVIVTNDERKLVKIEGSLKIGSKSTTSNKVPNELEKRNRDAMYMIAVSCARDVILSFLFATTEIAVLR